MPVSFTAIDFETANRSLASACALGVVRVRDGEVVDTRYSLIRPPVGHDAFEAGNVRIHGIRPSDVTGAPTFDRLWDWMCENIAPSDPDAVLVAHNAVFDTGVIKAANHACGGRPRPWEYACTLRLSRAAYSLRSYALPSASRAAGAEVVDHHNALSDSLACAGIVLDLARRSGARSMAELTAHYGVRMQRAEL
ncbi:3'-5' exonuclease [Kocuria tytonis]|uniref:DNA polymerase III subunit epsilon n=1 Tax=Kocuria tytonis TaxID=2054280 RepID=A0A495A9D1_9MICC|nr:3'-5' exonuclease [Kocuria tytonis]RKQ36637.1 DNA polymerase III subunit epsilon [Kocuria tytonis]